MGFSTQLMGLASPPPRAKLAEPPPQSRFARLRAAGCMAASASGTPNGVQHPLNRASYDPLRPYESVVLASPEVLLEQLTEAAQAGGTALLSLLP